MRTLPPTPNGTADLRAAVEAASIEDLFAALGCHTVGYMSWCPVCRPRGRHRAEAMIAEDGESFICRGVDDGMVFNDRRPCRGGTRFLLQRLVLERPDALKRFREQSEW